ncbi:DUF6602 domain-containing protein [Sulfurovum sp. ST-21]|uniref:DUF6602 domain-containing protein n=1 Tax=Sulfurovum indicum TaxID=2779528 RepID=A0A7M1S6R6_9BACT|nr:DUF6602 domain-containing protein [Sulfurovum indicum]QOR62812.1 hypothetical protein IMZ28_04915 [Sulfurovum indicum]
MIRKASELLELFIQEESRKLEGLDMPHMPTLGSAYEEVTKQGIDKNFAIPKFLDLRVVSGFITVGGEMLPQQVDCMLVHGDGQRYGLTEQFIYDIDKVLCLFEVKKTLRKNDYIDAFYHLGAIRRKFAEYFEYRLENEDYEPDIKAARRHFSQITGKIAPECYSGIHTLSKSDGILFYTLVQETLAPVSIIHGYEGYKTENGLRSAFIDILEEKRKKGGDGLGVPNIPTLVTSNNLCLVKGNGVPFLTIKDKNKWIAVFSTRHNSAKLILELIWSKISLYFDAKMPWNDGLHMDSIQPLLMAEAVEEGDKAGWMYNTLEFKEGQLRRDDDNNWEPAPLGKAEIAAINIMAIRGGYLPLDEEMDEFLKKEHDTSLNEVAENLILTRFFMRDENYIRPTTMHTHIITTDDGNGFVANEKDRFDLWCKEMQIEPYYMNLLFLE